MAIKKAFITGGTGFIGQALIKRLIKNRWKLTVLVRSKEKAQIIKNPNVEIVLADIKDLSWQGKVKGCEVFIHLSGLHGSLKIPWQERLAVELDGTKNAISASEKAEVKHFIHISTAYTKLPTLYGKAKKITESWVEQQIKKGFPATIVCPVTVYGPGDLVNLYRLFKAVNKRRFFFIGNGENLLQLIHIDDLTFALEKIMNQPKTVGKKIILGAETVSWKEFVGKIAEIEGVKKPSIYLPKLPFLISGKLFSWFSQKNIPVLFTEDTVITLTSQQLFDLKPGNKLLGLKPKTPLDENLRKTIIWYQKTSKF